MKPKPKTFEQTIVHQLKDAIESLRSAASTLYEVNAFIEQRRRRRRRKAKKS